MICFCWVTYVASIQLDGILKLEDERPWPKSTLWTPVEHVFKWNRGLHVEQGQQDDNDDDPGMFYLLFCCANNHVTCPDVIQGLQPKITQTSAQPDQSEPSLEDPCYGRDLGIPHGRDPDALPPGNVFEWISNTIYTLLVGLGSGNVVFAIKAGLLTVVLSLPSLMKNSAQLAYGTVADIQHMKSESDIHPFREPIRLGYVSSAIQPFVVSNLTKNRDLWDS